MKSGVNAVGSGVQGIANGARDMMNPNEENNTDGQRTTTNNNGYTATRTATTTDMDTTSNMFTWFIVLITAGAIVALVWAYMRERKTSNGYDE